MFTVFYIVVALLQFSIGEDAIQYEFEIPKELDTTIPIDYTSEDTIRYIESMTVEDNNESKTNNDVPETGENVEDENIGETIEPISVVYATQIEQEEITATSSDDDNKDFTSGEAVPTVSEPISFGGCAKAQGKVTIAARFGCGENTENVVTLPEDVEVPEEASDEPVRFEGPVHAQGKVIVGSHYGCGAPIRMYQPPVSLPWYPTFYYPQIYYPHPIPVFSAHYPFPILETSPFTVFQDNMVNEYVNFDDLPVASNLANSMTGDHNGIPFNGVVPAAGTVSIAARF